MIKQATKSVFSVVLLLLSCNLMADLVLSDGGATGTWFNATRSGEGFYIEIIENSDGSNAVSVAMYSFDENGDPLWLVGTGGVGAKDVSAQINLFEYDGPVWGPGFDSADLNETPFGTIIVRFPTCDTALFSIQSDGALESGDYSLVRLTLVEGVDCTEPPDPPPSGLTTGTWSGFGVCFHVSADGKSIIGGETSGCDAQMAFDANLDGITNELRNCKSSPSCEGIWPIVEGRFTCLNSQGELATGTFTSPTSASGVAVEPEAGIGEFCTAPWTASPD